MNSPREIQERRRDELLRRHLGPQLLAAIADPAITDIIINEDGRVWFEAHGKGLYAADFCLPESHRESLIGTVAAALGTVADADHPIVEGELRLARIRFEGLMPPVVMHPCIAMRKPAQVLYTLDDYIRAGIITEGQAAVFREATDRKQNVVIAGATGSGKTTLAGALINEMVARSTLSERYVIIEDTLEIQCQRRKSGSTPYQRSGGYHAPGARDHAPAPGPHHHWRSARRGGARPPEGMAYRASGRSHDDTCEFRQGGADAAFEPRPGGGSAAAAGADCRDY